MEGALCVRAGALALKPTDARVLQRDTPITPAPSALLSLLLRCVTLASTRSSAVNRCSSCVYAIGYHRRQSARRSSPRAPSNTALGCKRAASRAPESFSAASAREPSSPYGRRLRRAHPLHAVPGATPNRRAAHRLRAHAHASGEWDRGTVRAHTPSEKVIVRDNASTLCGMVRTVLMS
jgi:hypothetical protein